MSAPVSPTEPAPVDDAIFTAALEAIHFNEAGLVPAIAQSEATGAVLMMAWMNADAVRETLTTGRVTYWSRSRGSLWRKGESSGHIQALRDFRIDCDGDTLLLLVDQTGPACHTNRPNCFYTAVRQDGLTELSKPIA